MARRRTKEHNEKIRAALIARGISNSPTKVCPRCEQELPRSTFGTRKVARGCGWRTNPYCPPCYRAYARERVRKYMLLHPELKEKWKRTNRKTLLKRHYGITPEQYEDYKRMFDAQNGLCAICGRGPSRGRRHLDVDHCHKTLRVRGLLCTPCNQGLGHFFESVDVLMSAVSYLEKYSLSVN